MTIRKVANRNVEETCFRSGSVTGRGGGDAPGDALFSCQSSCWLDKGFLIKTASPASQRLGLCAFLDGILWNSIEPVQPSRNRGAGNRPGEQCILPSNVEPATPEAGRRLARWSFSPVQRGPRSSRPAGPRQQWVFEWIGLLIAAEYAAGIPFLYSHCQVSITRQGIRPAVVDEYRRASAAMASKAARPPQSRFSCSLVNSFGPLDRLYHGSRLRPDPGLGLSNPAPPSSPHDLGPRRWCNGVCRP